MKFRDFNSEDSDLPLRIVHGCDIIVREDGELEQYYNFLDYYFLVGGKEIYARAYLDTIGDITIRADLDFGENTTPEIEAIVLYLYRRYGKVYHSLNRLVPVPEEI